MPQVVRQAGGFNSLWVNTTDLPTRSFILTEPFG
jgi:hypothetical protein